MSRRTMAIVAVFFGVAYAVSSAIRGQVLPGLVTGVLAAVLVFLVLTRVQEHNAAVRRRRERNGRWRPPGD
jgi:L-lactate permease